MSAMTLALNFLFLEMFMRQSFRKKMNKSPTMKSQ